MSFEENFSMLFMGTLFLIGKKMRDENCLQIRMSFLIEKMVVVGRLLPPPPPCPCPKPRDLCICYINGNRELNCQLELFAKQLAFQ